MKTHTQQQTNFKKETTATEPKLSSRKRSEYKPRKWRGNTLVPVIIALAISAIATITFLNQGAGLQASNKSILAQNEIATMMNSWSILRASSAKTDIKAVDATLTGNQVKIPSSMLKTNVYGVASVYTADGNTLAYTTESEDSCKRIKISVDNMLGVTSSACAAAVLTITLN